MDPSRLPRMNSIEIQAYNVKPGGMCPTGSFQRHVQAPKGDFGKELQGKNLGSIWKETNRYTRAIFRTKHTQEDTGSFIMKYSDNEIHLEDCASRLHKSRKSSKDGLERHPQILVILKNVHMPGLLRFLWSNNGSVICRILHTELEKKCK